MKRDEIMAESLINILEDQHKNSKMKDSINYWSPLSKLIVESINLRNLKGVSQSELAQIMNTRQSVISRFENMGRKPNYDFIARLSQSLGHQPGMTLLGDYMAVVPFEKLDIVTALAKEENISTNNFVQRILEEGILNKQNFYKENIEFNFNDTSVIQDNDSLIEQGDRNFKYLDASVGYSKSDDIFELAS